MLGARHNDDEFHLKTDLVSHLAPEEELSKYVYVRNIC